MDFRNEVFKLCKTIMKKPETEEITKVIHSLCIHVEKNNKCGDDANVSSSRIDFGYISKQSSNQFYGYLFTDEYIDIFKENSYRIEHLEEKEKEAVLQGHATIMALVDGCLEDIKNNYPVLYDVINPYSKYKPIRPITKNSILSNYELENAISEFKGSKVYEKLISSQIVDMFRDLPKEQMGALMEVIYRDTVQTALDIVPKDIRDFSMRLLHKITDVPDLMMAGSVLILSLRESLAAACQLLFVALTGEQLIVLNNDNIISIDKNQSNLIHEVMTVLVDDFITRISTSLAGDILLIDCEPIENHHIHDFGMIMSATSSLNQETGQTTKIDMIKLDEDMNCLYNLTNTIIKADFPLVVKSGVGE